ncbi:MAG: alanine--tRNA ligase [Alphaproteobacteria bacterium]|nr:alanine--tRNA ligase [Alphaproteobacteria bacterium]
MTSVSQLRASFLDFFAKNGHEKVASSPLVPHNDPTLMFTNAGMVQFKNVFTGAESRPYKRAATSQKCVRAGGKHNDLDNVGYTARHHTFFEMLGNFSFGDYFKEQAIELAWNFLTKEMSLPKEKLLVTVYHTDDEAFSLWKKIAGLPESKIIRIPTSDNFWAMGDTGPCGPCSEIFFDHGDKIPGGPPGSKDEDGDRFIEIWNLVFMQYEQVTKEERVNLPKPSIDTGMGLERMAAVLQGVHDNYDIDLFHALIKASVSATGVKAEGEKAVSHRVIADHLRSSCFLIADGVMPSNEGRGYVLRRIMRRAMRHAHQLGCAEPLMHRLVPALVNEMGKAYPELTRAEALMTEVLKLEEQRFKQTLGRGLKLLDEETTSLKKGGQLKGDTAFKLYDTYGFPLDLTRDILRTRDITVDEPGFEAAMKEQKDRARAAWSGSGAKATDTVWFSLKEKLGATEFLGYSLEEAEGKIVAIVVDGKEVAQASAGQEVQILANQTPFYGESGGQMGDTGVITIGKTRIVITDTQKPLGTLIVHKGKVEQGEVKLDDIAHLSVDGERRTKLRANHSATHLLHKALRKYLGDHVTQKGSQVAEDKLRFDFSHPKAISPEELRKVETEINRYIRQNTDVATRLMTPDEAVAEGAMALFGEKYGDEVRVVSMGTEEEKVYSIELCGGTHVRRTGDIGLFKITGETAIAAGVRRLEAVTADAALTYLNEQEEKLKSSAALLKANPAELPEKITGLQESIKKLEAELSQARKAAAMGGGGGEVKAEDVGGVAFIGKTFADLPPKDLRDMATELRQKTDGIVAVGTSFEGKVSLIVALGGGAAGRFNAVELVNAGAAILGGKGGGKPDMAQAGGSDAAKLSEAMNAIKQDVLRLAS